MPVLETLVYSAWDTASWMYRKFIDDPGYGRQHSAPQFRNLGRASPGGSFRPAPAYRPPRRV